MDQDRPEWYLKYAPDHLREFFNRIPSKSNAPERQRKHKVKLDPPTKIPTHAKDLVELLTVKEVAKHLKCGISHIYELIERKEIICQPDGRRKLISVPELHAYQERQKKLKYGS